VSCRIAIWHLFFFVALDELTKGNRAVLFSVIHSEVLLSKPQTLSFRTGLGEVSQLRNRAKDFTSMNSVSVAPAKYPDVVAAGSFLQSNVTVLK
jgi:hypothetical protein